MSSVQILFELIEAGARIPTIAALTGILGSKARNFWRLQNLKPPSGRYPSLQQFLKINRQHIEISILAQHLHALIGQALSDVEIIHRAYKTHRILYPRSSVMVDHTFILWRQLRSGDTALIKCPACGGNVLKTNKVAKCCYCRRSLDGGSHAAFS